MAKVALLIGVSEYEPGLNLLPSAVKDVEAIQQVLVNPEIGGFAEADIVMLKNPPLQTIHDEIYRLFANRDKDDLLLFYFSGHGVMDDKGNLYLSNRATRIEKEKLVKHSALAASVLHEIIQDSRSQKQVLILDCCFSGAIAQGMTFEDDDKGRAILTSCTSTQYAFEQKDSELSIYTRYLVEGIANGAADLDGDGWISTQELHEYVSAKLKEVASANEEMTPRFYLAGEGYRIRLAKSPKDDPKLKYRKEVERFAQERRGKFSVVARKLLKVRQIAWGISTADAEEIENEVLQPYREYERKLQEFKKLLLKVLAEEYPFSDSTKKHLKEYQQDLGLRDEDVSLFEERIFNFGKGNFFVEELGNEVRLEMVAIPGDHFAMGSPKTESKRVDNESPAHSVTVKPFWIGKFPVTQAQWRTIASLPKVNIDLDPDPSSFKGDLRPVESVSWYAAVEFCARLSQKTNWVYRLPSEAEWEYACRAGTTTPFYFGETISTDLANYNGNSTYGSGSKGVYRGKTTEVGSFPPNAFGLYDMHGNVWEWCADHWHENYQDAPSDGSIWLSNHKSAERLLRGGSWYNIPSNCRSAVRGRYIPITQRSYCGFRVAVVVA